MPQAEEELIGDGLDGETVFYQQTSSGPKARYYVDLDSLVEMRMYFRAPATPSWGYFTSKGSDCTRAERHDLDGDGTPESNLTEKHCIPSGGYTLRLHRVVWRTDGSGWNSDTILFTRRIAMLDTLGSLKDSSAAGYQDVRVRFALDSVPTSLVGSLRGADFYQAFGNASDTALYTRAPYTDTLGIGDTLWFVSTYRAAAADTTVCGWCRSGADGLLGVLAAFNQDYLRTPTAFGYATNSVPAPGASVFMPMLHQFSAARPSEAFRVLARITEPYHNGTTQPGREQPDTIFVWVVGLDAAFTVSSSPVAGQPATFDAHTSEGYRPLQYRWDYGDQSPPTSWGADSVTQHTYSASGTFTAKLWVRRDSSTAPVDSASLTVSVAEAAALTVVIDGVETITSSDTYQWHALVSGGVPPYHYQWYYREAGQSEQTVGSDSPWYSRYVSVRSKSYAFRVRSVVRDTTQATAQSFLWVDVLAGGKGAGPLVVGLLDAAGVCQALPAGPERRRAAHEAVVAQGRWPVPCRVQ
jgi:hypothetical protein